MLEERPYREAPPARTDLGQAGVTAVVGVIVLVAIAVGMSAVLLFVLQQDATDRPERTSSVAFDQDPMRHSIRVAAADPEVWNAIRYTWGAGSDPTCAIKLNGNPPATATGGAPLSGIIGDLPGQVIKANDVLTVAGPVQGTGARCELLLTHLPLNQSYGSWTFNF